MLQKLHDVCIHVCVCVRAGTDQYCNKYYTVYIIWHFLIWPPCDKWMEMCVHTQSHCKHTLTIIYYYYIHVHSKLKVFNVCVCHTHSVYNNCVAFEWWYMLNYSIFSLKSINCHTLSHTIYNDVFVCASLLHNTVWYPIYTSRYTRTVYMYMYFAIRNCQYPNMWCMCMHTQNTYTHTRASVCLEQ